jgi:hypothetical protein
MYDDYSALTRAEAENEAMLDAMERAEYEGFWEGLLQHVEQRIKEDLPPVCDYCHDDYAVAQGDAPWSHMFTCGNCTTGLTGEDMLRNLEEV